MDRKQGLQLVELYFGVKRLKSNSYPQFMNFNIETSSVTACNLLFLIENHPLRFDEAEYTQRFGDQSAATLFAKNDPAYMAFLKEQEPKQLIRKMRPILNLFDLNITYQECSCECRMLIKTLIDNRRIAIEYKQRIQGWDLLMNDFNAIDFPDDKDDMKFDLRKYMPWLDYWRISKSMKPYDLYQYFISYTDEKTRSHAIIQEILEASFQYNCFHQKHADLLLKIADDHAFDGKTEWDTVPNEQSNLVIEKMKSFYYQNMANLKIQIHKDVWEFSGLESFWTVKKDKKQLWLKEDPDILKSRRQFRAAFRKILDSPDAIGHELPSFNEARKIFRDRTGNPLYTVNRKSYDVMKHHLENE